MLRIVLIVFACVVCETVFAQNEQTHTLQRGETIEFVAQMYGVSVDAIKEVNPHLKGFYTGITCVIPKKPDIHIVQADVTESEPLVALTENSSNSYVDELRAKAENYSSHKRYKKAAKTYTAILKIDHSMEDVYNRGHNYYRAGKWKHAISDLSTVSSNDDCTGWMKIHSQEMLADAREKREAQLEARGELWSGIAMLGLTAAAATATAVAAHEAQKNSPSGTTSYSGSVGSSYTSSSDDDDSSSSSTSSASSSSGGRKCGVCGGKGYTIEYASTFGLNDEKYCSECGKNVPAGHYHSTCSHCGGDGVR